MDVEGQQGRLREKYLARLGLTSQTAGRECPIGSCESALISRQRPITLLDVFKDDRTPSQSEDGG